MNYGDNILARIEAVHKHADDALMLNNAGNAACFTVGNIFMRCGDTLYTPPLSDGALDGIIRRLILERHGGIEHSCTPNDIKTADALYLTNSIRGIVSIRSLDGHVFKPAPLNFENDLHLRH